MTTTARDEILARVRAARGGPAPDVAVPRDYRGAGSLPLAGAADLLAERLADYGAIVRRCLADRVPATIGEMLDARDARRIVVPDGLPAAWVAAVVRPLSGAGAGSVTALDAADGVLTSVTVAIAQTGTLVLDHGPGQGPRALTLVPDLHLAVVAADRIVAAVPDAVAALDPVRPQTWISGPSATSDIELTRVEGVHGPRTLLVVVAE
jgi:L-lactate dehydrogenase complex protein LldG